MAISQDVTFSLVIYMEYRCLHLTLKSRSGRLTEQYDTLLLVMSVFSIPDSILKPFCVMQYKDTQKIFITNVGKIYECGRAYNDELTLHRMTRRKITSLSLSSF